MGGIAPCGAPTAVMNPSRSVQAAAQEETVMGKMPCQFVIDTGGIGLQAVRDYRTLTPIVLLQRNRFAKKIQPHQCRLASMPDRGISGLSCGHVPFDKLFQYFIRHAMTPGIRV